MHIFLGGIIIVPKLKYPILLVHGMGFRDNKYICYWGRIPKMIETANTVFFGNQDSNADIETNGHFIAERIRHILEQTGAEKINIIAHSKGGLDSRYAISKLGLGERVASLTTISTPHHGSKSVDILVKLPKFLIKFVCFFVDCWFRILGDKKPCTYKAISSFSTTAAEKFNADVPDCDNVFYQSYAFIMKKPTSDIFMWMTNMFVNLIEGENDGLVTPESAKWGEFKGTYKAIGKRGISHCDEVDMRRRPFSKKAGDDVSDILDVYKQIIVDLKELDL